MRSSPALHRARASETPTFGNWPFAKSRCILSRDTDRVFALLRQRGIVDNQHRIIAADQPVGLIEQLALQRSRIPNAISDEMVQLIVFARRKALRYRCSPGPINPAM
jgi:hypothetical protein